MDKKLDVGLLDIGAALEETLKRNGIVLHRAVVV
jgi:hypothetical protein